MKRYLGGLCFSMVAIVGYLAIAGGTLYGGVALWIFQCPGFSGALSVSGPVTGISAFCAVFGAGLLVYIPLTLVGIGFLVIALFRYLASVRLAHATISRARRSAAKT